MMKKSKKIILVYFCMMTFFALLGINSNSRSVCYSNKKEVENTEPDNYEGVVILSFTPSSFLLP